ncbi:PEP-CTERM sorting domain-containing protein [Noviherbaspirillum galbum]|uniref:PEP-CTERM sorting domain-containing protein n=1 Tax=Noviherbaspirillum galbum TaxID=2709383 RepID=A0A6B3SK98_9BURK|nr:PEP-CTERM sorting domain-containing protein [Noviherbaspirillum galbum]NEX61213.1 PEP-CTERM sorting domain-containing protein [Noviherbaspirillum galbum]
MMTMKKLPAMLVLAGLALTGGMANATVYSNSNDASSIQSFGSPDTTSYGQTFNLGVASTVLDWSFYATSGNAGNLELVIANWNGSRAVGPALYLSPVASYAGGAQTVSFNGINAVLSAGSYIAYLTVAGVAGPVSGVGFAGSSSDGGLGGGFRFLNSGGTDPLLLNDTWSNWFVPDMQFTANIVPGGVRVPEPGTLALLGLGVLAFAASRRGAKATNA